jgi:hypothetical protein
MPFSVSPLCRRMGATLSRMLDQLCKRAESPVSSSLPACRDTTCTESRLEACIITCTCSTNFGPQNMGRKSNMCARGNWGVPIKASTSANNTPRCVVRKSVFYPSIELHRHRGSAWRVIKCLPLVTDFIGRVLGWALVVLPKLCL